MNLCCSLLNIGLGCGSVQKRKFGTKERGALELVFFFKNHPKSCNIRMCARMMSFGWHLIFNIDTTFLRNVILCTTNTSALPMGFPPWLSHIQTYFHLVVWWWMGSQMERHTLFNLHYFWKVEGLHNTGQKKCFIGGGPFLCTGFSILSRTGWVGGAAQSAWKNYKQGKNLSTKKSILFCEKKNEASMQNAKSLSAMYI